jgi:hypothetical protein
MKQKLSQYWLCSHEYRCGEPAVRFFVPASGVELAFPVRGRCASHSAMKSPGLWREVSEAEAVVAHLHSR